jgi:hypothetical protein
MFDQGLWAPIAILVAVGFVVMAVVAIKWLRDQRVIPSSPEEEEDMAHLPMTTLQRRAWWALAFGLSNDDSLRSVVVVLVFLSLAVYLGMLLPTALQVGRSGVDERDQKVLTTAPSVQAGAMMITTVAWTIYLTEEFRGIGIPTEYRYPLAGSVFLVFMLAHSVGILIGYWLSRRHAQS